MRVRAETLLIAVMAVFAMTGWLAVHFLDNAGPDYVTVDPRQGDPIPPDHPIDVGPAPQGAAAWFQQVRGFCNPVDVETRMQWQPAPSTDEGLMYEAACYALAGKVDLARASIEALPPADQYKAAGVVFNAGHPAADAGDEVAAGPLMELVVEFWPNHYMALYHAGAAAYEMGDSQRAHGYLTRFLQHYGVEDGWRSNALSMLDSIRQGG